MLRYNKLKVLITSFIFLFLGQIDELFAQKDSLLVIEKAKCPIPDMVQIDTISRASSTIKMVGPREVNGYEIRRLIGYPLKALNADVQGDVILRVYIDENGNYVEHTVISGHPLLVEGVEKHISKARFTPAMKDGKPVKFWANVPFRFVIDDDLPKHKKNKKK